MARALLLAFAKASNLVICLTLIGVAMWASANDAMLERLSSSSVSR
jgi:hypothetical protein